MATTFRQLLTVRTKDKARDLILDILGVAGFAVSSWSEFSFPLRTVNAVAALLADAFLFNTDLAANAFGETATDKAWQDVWGYDRFQLTRDPSVKLTGVMVAKDNGAGPHTGLTPGSIIVADATDSTLIYVNTTTVTIPANGSVDVPMEAADRGAKYNIPNNSTLRLVSDIPTVTVTNPAQSGSDSWITTAGADEESLKAFHQRCWLRWRELSVETPKGFYASKIRNAIPTITKVHVNDDNPYGPNTAQVVCATGAGPASGTDLTLANSLLATMRAVGRGRTDAVAATAITLPVQGTCYVKAESLVAARSAIQSELAQLQADTDIAGTVYAAEIVRIVKSQSGVRNFIPAGGLVDVTAGDTEVITIRHEITYVAE